LGTPREVRERLDGKKGGGGEKEEEEPCAWAPGSPTGKQGSDLMAAKRARRSPPKSRGSPLADRPGSTLTGRGRTPKGLGGRTYGHGHLHDLVEELAQGRGAEETAVDKGEAAGSVMEMIRHRRTVAPMGETRGTMGSRWGTRGTGGGANKVGGNAGPRKGENWTTLESAGISPEKRRARGDTISPEKFGTIASGQRAHEPGEEGLYIAPYREAPTPRACAGWPEGALDGRHPAWLWNRKGYCTQAIGPYQGTPTQYLGPEPPGGRNGDSPGAGRHVREITGAKHMSTFISKVRAKHDHRAEEAKNQLQDDIEKLTQTGKFATKQGMSSKKKRGSDVHVGSNTPALVKKRPSRYDHEGSGVYNVPGPSQKCDNPADYETFETLHQKLELVREGKHIAQPIKSTHTGYNAFTALESIFFKNPLADKKPERDNKTNPSPTFLVGYGAMQPQL